MVTLRPYQTEAAQTLTRLLMAHNIAYLRGEVRTGKTLTVMATNKAAASAWPATTNHFGRVLPGNCFITQP